MKKVLNLRSAFIAYVVVMLLFVIGFFATTANAQSVVYKTELTNYTKVVGTDTLIFVRKAVFSDRTYDNRTIKQQETAFDKWLSTTTGKKWANYNPFTDQFNSKYGFVLDNKGREIYAGCFMSRSSYDSLVGNGTFIPTKPDTTSSIVVEDFSSSTDSMEYDERDSVELSFEKDSVEVPYVVVNPSVKDTLIVSNIERYTDPIVIDGSVTSLLMYKGDKAIELETLTGIDTSKFVVLHISGDTLTESKTYLETTYMYTSQEAYDEQVEATILDIYSLKGKILNFFNLLSDEETLNCPNGLEFKDTFYNDTFKIRKDLVSLKKIQRYINEGRLIPVGPSKSTNPVFAGD